MKKEVTIREIYEDLEKTYGDSITTYQKEVIKDGKKTKIEIKKRTFVTRTKEGIISSLYCLSGYIVKFLNGKTKQTKLKDESKELINKVLSHEATTKELLRLCSIAINNRGNAKRSNKQKNLLSKNEKNKVPENLKTKEVSVVKDKNYFESQFRKLLEETMDIHGCEGVINILEPIVEEVKKQRQYHLDQIYGKGL